MRSVFVEDLFRRNDEPLQWRACDLFDKALQTDVLENAVLVRGGPGYSVPFQERCRRIHPLLVLDIYSRGDPASAVNVHQVFLVPVCGDQRTGANPSWIPGENVLRHGSEKD